MYFLKINQVRVSVLYLLLFIILPILFIWRFCKRKRRSAVFLGDCYYNFYFLAEALRNRGWKAISVKIVESCTFSPFHHVHIPPSSGNFQSFLFFLDILANYQIVHFYGSFNISGNVFFNKIFYNLHILKMFKISGIKVAYTKTGCLDGSSQKEIYQITGGLCDKCIWQDNPAVCDDNVNFIKTEAIKRLCDLFCCEVDWPTELGRSIIAFPLPLVSALDSTYYSLTLSVPEKYKINRLKNHLIVFTAFGNQETRSSSVKDIKGMQFIVNAINRLKDEGEKIQHVHANNMLSQDMRYLQCQADIIVDQLCYGSIGAAAREGMMLGKPVICYISSKVRDNYAMKDCPAVSATENDIYEILKKLLRSSVTVRKEIGFSGREWMYKWCEASVCAERYEKVFDRLRAGRPPFCRLEFCK